MPRDATQYEGRDQHRRKRARELANSLPGSGGRVEDNDSSTTTGGSEASPDERPEDTPSLFGSSETK